MTSFRVPASRRRKKTPKQRGKTAQRKGVRFEGMVKRFLQRRRCKPVTGRIRPKGAEFDLLMKNPQGRSVVVEAKNLKNPVSATAVERLGKKINKPANKAWIRGGVMVSKSGYTKEAEKMARSYHIKLLQYSPPKRQKETGWLF